MPANRRTDIDTGTRSLPGGGYQQHPTSLLRYQDISKISDISVSGETIPAQVKIVRTAHLGVDVKKKVRSIPIIAARHHCNAMFRPMPRDKGMSGHNNGVCMFTSCIYGNYQLLFVVPC